MLFRSNKIALNLKETPEGLFELILTYNQESKDTINSVVTSWDAYSDRNRWDNTEIPGLIKKSYEILYPIKDKDKEKDKRLFREQTSLATKLLSVEKINNNNIEFYSDECTPEQIDRGATLLTQLRKQHPNKKISKPSNLDTCQEDEQKKYQYERLVKGSDKTKLPIPPKVLGRIIE